MAQFVAHSSDTDCDGTLFCVRLIEARSLADANTKLGSYYQTSKVEPLADFTSSELWHKLPPYDQAYFLDEGYLPIGADWNPWVYDDSIGIPALDSRYDEPMKGW
jgi:hypothetical protein